MTSAQIATDTILELDPEDAVRAQLYRLLASLLSDAPSESVLAVVAGLLGDESDLGRAIDALATQSRVATRQQAADEFQALFIGLGRGELVPYGSFYLTGFLQEKPLARLRADMGALGIVRDPSIVEPEDHIASVMEAMAGLIDGSFGPQLTQSAQKLFYDAHIGSWAGHFFRDLEAASNATFYPTVGAVGRCFLEVEEQAFRMS